MSSSEYGRAGVYIFMASVGLLFSIRMFMRARRDSGPVRYPHFVGWSWCPWRWCAWDPHWYDVVAIYLSSWVVVGYGIALRIALGEYWSDHSRWALGVFYQGYAFVATALAIYYWTKPSVEVLPPPFPKDD